MKRAYILFFSFWSCSTPKAINFYCDMEQAIRIANHTFKKAGYSLQHSKYSIEPIDSFYVIHYLPKDFNVRGGEAILKISQDQCKIVQKDFYQ